MPRVPRLPGERVEPTGVPSTGLSPLESPRLNVQVDPQSLGSAIGGGLVNLGNTGLEIARREKIRQDEARVRSAQRLLQEWELETLWTGENAAMRRQGIDTAAMPGEVEESFRQTSSQIREGLANDEQKIRFDDLSELHRLRVNEQTARHQIREMDKFSREELKSFLQNSVNLARENADNPERVAEEIDSQITEIVTFADEQGWGPEVVRQMVEATRSDSHAAVIERLLAQGNDRDAQTYYSAIQDEVIGDVKSKIESYLKEGSLRGESRRKAEEILFSTATEAEALEQARTIDDSKLMDATITRVKSWWADRNRLQQQALQDLHNHAINIVDQGGALEDIAPSDWVQLTAAQKNSITEYHKKKNAPGGVATNWEVYYRMMRMADAEPENFVSVDLMILRSVLGDAEFKQLTNLQRDMSEGMTEDLEALDGFRTADDIVMDAWREMGFDPNPKAESDEATRLARFRREVDKEVQAEQRRTGRPADIQSVVDRLLIETVPEQAPWFWVNTPSQLQFERPLTIDDIPAEEQNSIVKFLNSRGARPDNQSIVDVYLELLKQRQRNKE